MVIRERNGKYEVYGTGEKASMWGIAGVFDTKEEALDDLIYRARF